MTHSGVLYFAYSSGEFRISFNRCRTASSSFSSIFRYFSDVASERLDIVSISPIPKIGASQRYIIHVHKQDNKKATVMVTFHSPRQGKGTHNTGRLSLWACRARDTILWLLMYSPEPLPFRSHSRQSGSCHRPDISGCRLFQPVEQNPVLPCVPVGSIYSVRRDARKMQPAHRPVPCRY